MRGELVCRVLTSADHNEAIAFVMDPQRCNKESARISHMSVRSWSEYQHQLLLEGSWLPVTGCILFVKAPADRCADILVNGVRGAHVRSFYGHPLRIRRVEGRSLAELLATLLPLELPENRRTLFLPTANPEWTAMYMSDLRGHDPQSAMAWFAVAGVESVSVTDQPNNYDAATRQGFSGVRKIEMYELPPPGGRIGHSLGVRVADSSRWELVRPSIPFPVGNIWDPMAKRISERFTHEHLVEMTGLFGLRPFDEDFYAADGQGVIVERTDPAQSDEQTFTLAQARGEEPVVW